MPVKAAVSAKIEAQSEETPHIFISADIPAPKTEPVAISEPEVKVMMAEKETEKPAPMPAATKPQAASKSTPASAEPKSGDRAVIDGEPHVLIPRFGWILDEGGGSVCTTVDNPGDQLTGYKVGIMRGGTTVDGKGDIHKQVGIMGGADSAPHETSAPPSKQPEITGDVIYVELQPPVTKDRTSPVYKPNGELYHPYITNSKGACST